MMKSGLRIRDEMAPTGFSMAVCVCGISIHQQTDKSQRVFRQLWIT